MAIKTFTAGSVLTAADTNTYLANSGLVYITSQTVGSAVSTVTVSSAFNSTYDSYKIIYTGGVCSTTLHIGFKLGTTATGYYGGLIYINDASNVPTGVLDVNASSFSYSGGGTTGHCLINAELHNPFTANYTLMNNFNMSFVNYATYNGSLRNTTSYTAFTLIPSGGTITGGTITVYGYRKA